MAKKLKQQEPLCASLISGFDAGFDYICQSCNEDGKQLEAVGFCVDCSEFLCDECFRYHKKSKFTRHHNFRDIMEAKKDRTPSVCLDICTEKCTQHRGKAIEYFCVDHDCLGCGLCLYLDHKSCQRVQYIPKKAKDMGNGEEFSTLMRKLDKLLLKTKNLADMSLGNKLKSQDMFDKALDHVKQVKKRENEVLNKWEKEIETEARILKEKDVSKMEEHIKSCDNIQKKAQNLSFDMKAMQKKGQYCNLFVAMKTTKTEFRSMVKSIQDILHDKSVSEYRFQPSEQLDNFLKHDGRLGKLFMEDTKKAKATQLEAKATKVREISVKRDSDSKTCDISGMALITGGKLAAVDCNNSKVKLIDIKKCRLITEYTLPYIPYDITTTGESGEVAVTQPSYCEIVLLRIRADMLYEQKKIRTSGRCYGIAYIKNKFVVSMGEPVRLDIIDIQGNRLQSIEKDGNGRQLFSGVASIAVCQNTDSIYVPNYYKHRVTKLSLSGHVVGIYEDSDLKFARCVAVDKTGVIYACGIRPHIHQVTPDCKKISILLSKSDGLGSVKSLFYDGNTDCLYIGQENDRVLVYQLS